MWIDYSVDNSFIFNFHHSSCKLQSWNSFFNVRLLALDICNHNSFAVTTNWISQKVGQHRLSVRNVISLFVWESQHNLFQVGKTLVYMSCLYQLCSSSLSLLGSFRTSQIYKLKFWVCHFFCWLNSWSWFNVNCVDTMGSWRMGIKLMCSIISIRFTFKKLL